MDANSPSGAEKIRKYREDIKASISGFLADFFEFCHISNPSNNLAIMG